MDKINRNRYIGIDLGTTNTCIASSYYNTRDGKVEVDVMSIKAKRIDAQTRAQEKKYLPSVIYVDTKDDSTARIIVGSEAKDLAQKIRSSISGSNSPFLMNFKKDMGTEQEWIVNGVKFTPVTASAEVLKKCGSIYNNKWNAHGYDYKDTPTVITVPARFGSEKKKDTLNASKVAGFKYLNDKSPENLVRTLPEPSAALLSFIYTELGNRSEDRSVDIEEVKRFLVVDLGGGTCDVVVIDVQEKMEDNKSKMYFAPFGNPDRVDIGGADFDKKVAEYLMLKFFNDKGLNIKECSSEDLNSMVNKLVLQVEIMKEIFSDDIEDDIVSNGMVVDDYVDGTRNINDIYDIIENGEISIPKFYKDYDFFYSLSLKEYLEVVNSLIVSSNKVSLTTQEDDTNKNLEDAIRRTLKDCKCDISEIDYVLFTGGMSKFIPLKKRVYDIVGKKVLSPEDPMTAVAIGAALYSLFKDAEENRTYGDESELMTVIGAETVQDEGPRVVLGEMKNSIENAYLIDLKDQLPSVIIEKNTQYPLEKQRIVKKYKTNSEVGVIINLYSGRDQYDPLLTRLKPIVCDFKGRFKDVGTFFDIEYEINREGIPSFKIIFDDGDEFESEE